RLNTLTAVFAGREEELTRLDAFVEGRRNGVLLVTAPAGFGKSALLANWVKPRLGTRRIAAYHFFSQDRDDTRPVVLGWRNLLRQLYAFHDLPEWPLPDDDKGVRDALATVLSRPLAESGPPIVIVIDALDEADEVPDLPLPTPLPNGLFVIASLRAANDE